MDQRTSFLVLTKEDENSPTKEDKSSFTKEDENSSAKFKTAALKKLEPKEIILT